MRHRRPRLDEELAVDDLTDDVLGQGLEVGVRRAPLPRCSDHTDIMGSSPLYGKADAGSSGMKPNAMAHAEVWRSGPRSARISA